MARSETIKKRVVVVDDHPLIRRGIVQLINDDPKLAVVGEAEDATAGLDAIVKQRPDIAVVDISLKNSSGMDLIKDVVERMPGLPVLVFSMHDEAFYAEQVLRTGAKGYVTKGEPPAKVIEGIHRVLAGQIFVSEKVAATMLRRVVGGKSEAEAFPIDRLSQRENEIFRMIGQGLQSRQIAEKLDLSVKTVESHRENIKRKLNVDNATELLQRAIYWLKFEDKK